MRSNRYYINCGDVYDQRVIDVAEKLWKERETLQDQTISWEPFTEEYMKFGLPATKMDDVYWKRYRSRWAEDVSGLFLYCKYDALLIVRPNAGVKFLIGKDAVRKYQATGIKKMVNATKTAMLRCKKAKVAFPTFSKSLNGFVHVLEDAMYSLSGRIQASEAFPKDQKKQLLEIIGREFFRDDEDDDEDGDDDNDNE